MKLDEILNNNGSPFARLSGSAAEQKKKRVRCPACHGQQTQYCQKSGMRELCRACEGRGTILNPQLADD